MRDAGDGMDMGVRPRLRFRRTAAVAVLVCALAACTTARDPPTQATAPLQPNAYAAVPERTVATTAATDYRIGPLDVLEVSVFQVPDLDKTVQVTASGQIALPLIGAVTAAGRTVAELQDDIAAKLGAKYLQSPQVSVFVKDAESQRVTVEGAVKNPGIYPTAGDATLLRVVALAGGLDRVANEHGVIVFRQIAGKRHAAVFDYAAIRAGRSNDPAIDGGDVVVVDQSGLKATMRGVRESVGVMGLFVPFL